MPRLRLTLLLLLPGLGCLAFDAEAPPAPGDGGGGTGGQAPTGCLGDPARDCAGCGRPNPGCDASCSSACPWERPELSGDAPPGLSGPAVLCDEERGVLWVFGGGFAQPPSDSCPAGTIAPLTHAQLWSIEPGDEGSLRWVRHEVAGPAAPPSRLGAVLLPGKDGALFLHGGSSWEPDASGCGREPVFLADVWKIEPEGQGAARFTDVTGTVAVIPAGQRPGAREAPFVVRRVAEGDVLILNGTASAAGAGEAFPARDGWSWSPATETFTLLGTELFGELYPDPNLLPVNGAALLLPAVEPGKELGRRVLALGGTAAYPYAGTDLDRDGAGDGIYYPEAWLLDLSSPGEARWQRAPGLGLPAEQESFGAATSPTRGPVAFSGYRRGQVGEEKTYRFFAGGWQVDALADQLSDQGRDQHPGDATNYALVSCPPLGGTLLVGGQPRGLAPWSRVYRLPDAAPPAP